MVPLILETSPGAEHTVAIGDGSEALEIPGISVSTHQGNFPLDAAVIEGEFGVTGRAHTDTIIDITLPQLCPRGIRS